MPLATPVAAVIEARYQAGNSSIGGVANRALRKGRTAGRLCRAQTGGFRDGSPPRRAQARRDPGGGRGRLSPADGADEEGTLAALQAHRRDLVDPLLAEHRGRIVKLMGDGALVEFASVVGRGAMRGRNPAGHGRANGRVRRGRSTNRVPDRDQPRRCHRRGDDIYGDGVNVASRLEALSPPGGIAVSAAVRSRSATMSSTTSSTW